MLQIAAELERHASYARIYATPQKMADEMKLTASHLRWVAAGKPGLQPAK